MGQFNKVRLYRIYRIPSKKTDLNYDTASLATLSGTLAHLLIHTIIRSFSHVAVAQWKKSCNFRSRVSVNVLIKLCELYQNVTSVTLTVEWLLILDGLD